MVVSTVAIFQNCILLPCFKGNSTMYTSILPFMLINCILTFLGERLLSSLFGWRNCIFSRFCNFATFFFADSTFSQLKRGCYPIGMPFVLHQRRHYQSGFTRCQYSTGSTQIPTYLKDPFFVQKIKSYQNFQEKNSEFLFKNFVKSKGHLRCLVRM